MRFLRSRESSYEFPLRNSDTARIFFYASFADHPISLSAVSNERPPRPPSRVSFGKAVPSNRTKTLAHENCAHCPSTTRGPLADCATARAGRDPTRLKWSRAQRTYRTGNVSTHDVRTPASAAVGEEPVGAVIGVRAAFGDASHGSSRHLPASVLKERRVISERRSRGVREARAGVAPSAAFSHQFARLPTISELLGRSLFQSVIASYRVLIALILLFDRLVATFDVRAPRLGVHPTNVKPS